MALWRHNTAGFSLGAFAQDLLSVILGVLIALAVDEWRDDRRKQQEARAALTELKRELDANHALIRSRQSDHRRLDSLLGQLLNIGFERERLERKAVLLKWFALAPKGFGAADGSALAWQLALQSRAVEQFDPATRLMLADVYEENQQLHSVTEYTLKNLFATPATDGNNIFGAVLAAKGTMGDVVAGEQRLIALYPRALARVDSLLAR